MVFQCAPPPSYCTGSSMPVEIIQAGPLGHFVILYVSITQVNTPIAPALRINLKLKQNYPPTWYSYGTARALYYTGAIQYR
jgi:hypothetical protein